ncbi:hypothetical protein L9F63_019064, partial [Diploptera punctata]
TCCELGGNQVIKFETQCRYPSTLLDKCTCCCHLRQNYILLLNEFVTSSVATKHIHYQVVCLMLVVTEKRCNLSTVNYITIIYI